MNVSRGEIYDLGYRNYDGPRLGRWYVVRSLTALSLRHTFGFGRGVGPKVIAFALIAFTLIPALVQVALGVLVPEDFEFVRPEEYYGFVQVIIILFVAAMASELVGNDRRNNVLPLYFSRPLLRSDYVFAKVTALTLGLQALTLVPQLLMYLGNWFGAEDQSEWLGDNLTDLPAIVASAVLVSAEYAAIAIVIATFASKRAFALVGILGAMLVSSIVTGVLSDFLPLGAARVVMLLSPIYVTRAVTFVVFDAMPRARSMENAEGVADQIAAADLPGFAWVAACVVHIALAVWFAIRRYRDTI
jgi:ABC-2 type transport system permease protein